MNISKLNYQVRSYMSYKGQKSDRDYYKILFNKISKEILFKHDYYNLKLLYDSFKNYPNCNILTFDEVDFYNAVEFEFMLNLVNDTKQINTLKFKAINLHNYVNELVKFIKNNHTIKSISFNQSGINNEDLKLLCKAMKENDTLTTLDLSSNNTFSNVEPICNLIQNNTNITTLYFNNVYNCDFIPLIETLKTNNSIKKIKIYESSIKIFDSFWNMLKINNSINHVSFRSSYNIDMLKIKEVLTVNKTITELSLYNANTDDWKPLIELLKTNNILTYINLNNCRINDYKQFYEIIKNNSNIKVLKLNHYLIYNNNDYIDNDIDVLIDALEHNKTIEKLFVYGINVINPAKYLKTIINHPSLKEINAEIDRKYTEEVWKAIYNEENLIDIGYQPTICYTKIFNTTDKNKYFRQFVYV